MKKTILTYGLISGLVAAVLMVASALYFRNSTEYIKSGELLGYTLILLSMVVVYFGVRSYRDQVKGGSISFGQAFQVGMLISLVSSVCYVLTWLVVYETLMPDFMEKYAEYSLAQLRLSGASEEVIRQDALKMEQYKVWYQNPLIRAAFTFMEPLPVGILVTLLTSFLLRRKVA